MLNNCQNRREGWCSASLDCESLGTSGCRRIGGGQASRTYSSRISCAAVREHSRSKAQFPRHACGDRDDCLRVEFRDLLDKFVLRLRHGTNPIEASLSVDALEPTVTSIASASYRIFAYRARTCRLKAPDRRRGEVLYRSPSRQLRCCTKCLGGANL
jgi:hypothetical protein